MADPSDISDFLAGMMFRLEMSIPRDIAGLVHDPRSHYGSQHV